MKDKKIVFLLILALIISLETTFLFVKSFKKIFHKSAGCYGSDVNINKALAEEYLNQGLYENAIVAYEEYIKSSQGLSAQKMSNIVFSIGNIYMNNLSDYKNALANFIKAKEIFPCTAVILDINKNIVSCLERLGKSLDAERELAKATSIDKDKQGAKDVQRAGEGGVVVATLGDRNITMQELNAEIEKLPDFIRDTYKDNNKKIEFLQQYITTELLYESAKRMVFDTDKDVIERAFMAKKQIMIDKLIQEEIRSKIPEPQESDLKLYYDANKDKYMEEKKDDAGNVTKAEKEFKEVKEAIRAEYLSKKAEERFKEFVDNLVKTKDIKIYDDQLK